MDYSPEDLQLFQKYGVSPDTHELDRNTWEFVPKGGNKIQPEGELATFARSMAGGAGPAIGAGLGGTAGTVAGTALAPLAGPAAPIVPAATGIVGGVVGGQLGGKSQHAIAEAVAPDLTGGWNLQEEANAKENPKSAFTGTLASMLLSNQLTPVKNLKGLQGLFTAGGKAGAKKTAQQMAINAGIGSGMEAANQVLPNVDWNKNNMGLDDVELEPSKIAMAGGANLLLGDFRKPFHAVTDKLAARGPAAIKAASEKLAAERGATSLLDDATKAIKSPTKIKTTPEGAATIEQQFRDVVDPASSRAAVFVPEGTTVNTKLPAGLVEVKRPDGVAFVNPQKGADVELIRTSPEMPGDALGMSQTVKPADGTDVVVGEKGGNEVSAEVVNGNDPAAVKAATEAASNASPGADVKVTSPQEVLENRLKSWRERERAITEVPLADQAAIQRAKEKQHADHMAKLNAEFEASLGRTEQEVKAAQNKNAQNAEQARLNDEAAFWKQQHAQTEQQLAEWRQAAEEARVKLEAERKRRADDFEKARIEKDTQDREAAEQDAWNKKKTFIWGKGQTGRLAGLENRPTGDFVKPEDPSLSAPLNEAEQIQERFDRNKYQTDEDAINAQIEAYEKSLLEEEAAAAGVKPEAQGEKTPKAKAPPVIKPLEGKISQAWYDLWKRAGFDKYGATTDQRAGMLTDEGKPARGSYNPETRQVEVDPARADFDNQPHELFHAWLIDVAEHGNSAEKSFAKKMLERFGAEEPGVQATGEHAVSRAKGDDSFLKDALAFVKYKVGRANERDFARLASNEMYRGRGFKGEVEGLKPTVGGVRNQPDDDRVFVTDFEKELNNNPSRPFKIQVAKDGRVSANDVRAALVKAHPVEQELLKQAGIDDYLKQTVRPTPGELANWIKENGPRVETLSYGQQGKVSKERMELDQLWHEWGDNLPSDKQRTLNAYLMNGADAYIENWKPEDAQNARRAFELKKAVDTEPPDTSPRATHFYNQVSPKDTKKFPVQRVDVVLPLKKKLATEQERIGKMPSEVKTERGELWSPDNLHENVPNTLGWAAIQYETLPSGEKVAHIYEVQSRWGQEVRAEQKLLKEKEARSAETGVTYGIQQRAKEGRLLKEHPLLKDYNRLILKAAIDEAHKNGATKIAISDAETAMMSEMHDQQFGGDYRSYETEELAKQRQAQLLKEDGLQSSIEKVGNEWRLYSRPKQETGMRFNYDNALPRIAEELTGSKGEPVNFGEHKNSRDGGKSATYPEGAPRDNLIFRNPDGTPKTDVTARMYDISTPANRRASGEPYGLVNKRYQGDDTEPRKFEKQPAAILSSHVGKLRKSNDPKLKAAGDALLETYHDRTELTGRWSETAKDALHTDNATANAARDWLIHAEATETEGYPEGASDKLKAAIDSFRAMYRQVREDQNARKLPVRDRDNNMREGRMDPTGMPHLLDQDAGYLLKHGQGTEEWHQMAEEFKDFNRPRMQERHQIGKKNPLSDEAIEAILDAKIRKLSGAEPMRGTSSEWRAHARALRLAEDTKLPPSMIEKDFKKLITKYIGAAAKDLALHSNVEANSELNDTFGLNDQVKPEDTRAGNSELSKALDEYMGNVQEESKLGQIGNSASALATTAWTSNPVSRGKDFAGTFFRGLAHAKNPFQWPSITASAIKGLVSKDVKTAARVGGLVQPRHNFMDNMIGNTERVKNWVRKSANAYSTATGSEALENHSRYMAQGMGRTLVDIHGDAALRGDKSSQIFMEELAPVKWQEMLGTENGRNLLASRVGEAFQAAYNGSNLPDWALKGQFAPYARLMKWSIEQANNFRRFQLRPLIENKDPRPLAMYVTTMLGGGFAVKKLAETIANRQSYTPTWLEIENAKDKDKAKQAAAAKVMNAIEMVGMFGVFSSLGNMVTQAMTGQATPTPSNPFLSATGDSLNYAVAAGRAILDGQDPMKVLPKAMDDIANSQISMYRVGKNWLADDKEKMQRQGRRDYAVYQTLAGEKVEPYNKRYSYESADENEFDRAELKDSPRIIREIIVNTPRAKLPEKMQKLGSIGGDNIGPSSKDTDKLMAYIDYIRRTQGEAKARQLARTIMRDDVEKDIKRSMVPR